MTTPRARRRLAFAVAILVASLTLSGCQFFGGTTPSAPEDTTGGSDATAGAATPAANAEQTPAATPRTSATVGAGHVATANITVSPSEVTVGNAVLTFRVDQAQPAYDPAREAADDIEGDGQRPTTQPKGYAVLGGLALKVTNNFDSAQTPPADQPREVLRHVGVQIRDKESGLIIPHVEVSMDLLRDGRSVLQDQPLVPMVEAGGRIDKMQYGNNVKFPGKGEYQVFVRLEPNPLLGQTGAAQFNVSVK